MQLKKEGMKEMRNGDRKEEKKSMTKGRNEEINEGNNK